MTASTPPPEGSSRTDDTSPLSADVTGQIIEASGRAVAIAEPWRRGPKAGPIEDPHDVDAIVRPLIAAADPGTTMAEAL